MIFMLDSLIAFDHSLFLWINQLPHPLFLVFLALLLSGAGSLGLIWFIVAILFIFKERHQPKILLELLFGIISAFFVSELAKTFFSRLRPELTFSQVEIYTKVYTKVNNYLAFPSTHSTIAFTAAFILAKLFPKGKFYFYLLAFLIAFSRVYLGVHYFSDIFAGGLLGLTIGWLVIRLLYTNQTSNRGKLA